MTLNANFGCDHNRNNGYSQPGAKNELLNHLRQQQVPEAFHRKKLQELESYLMERIAFYAHPANMMEVAEYILEDSAKNPAEIKATFGRLVDTHVIESSQSINTQIKTYFDGGKFSFVLSVPETPTTNPHATPNAADQDPSSARAQQTERKISWSEGFEQHILEAANPRIRHERSSGILNHFSAFIERMSSRPIYPVKENIQPAYLEELGWTLTWVHQEYKDRVVIVLS